MSESPGSRARITRPSPARILFSLELFGGATLTAPAGAAPGRAAQRQRLALLALVAVSGPGGMTRDKLVAYLWPELDAERGRQLLSNSLYVLRQALGEDVLVGSGDIVRLDLDRLRCDVHEFEGALARGEHERAVELYSGPFLDGFFLADAAEFERWAERERARLAASHARTLEALAESAERTRDFQRASDWWRARAAHDPLDSRVACRLMQALENAGNRAGALQHGSTHERLLQDELGVAVTSEVASLMERLRAEPPRGRPVEPPGPVRTMPAEATAAAASPADAPRAVPAAAPPDEVTWPPAPQPPVVPVRTTRRRSFERRVAVAFLALVVVAAVLWGRGPWPRSPEPERSIVVLPFVSRNVEPASDFLGDGLTEEIITRLASVPGLKVISRTSAMHYKGSTASLRTIAGELRVAHVLEGSVRRDDGRLHVTAQLVDASTEDHRWAASYDVAPRRVFDVQEEIARQVVRALGVQLPRSGVAPLARRGTRDPVAYELYQRGRHFWSARTADGHRKALDYYRRAIERDSSYADPYAGLADAYLTAFQLGLSSMSEQETYSRLTWAAERALALDERSADAHTSFAVSLWWQRNWPGAERELRRAIELNPGNASARSWYALLLAGRGRPDEAKRESRLAADLDPFALIVSLTHAWACYQARDHDGAIEQFRRTLELNESWRPTRAGLGLAYAMKGMFDDAIREVAAAAEAEPRSAWYLADLAYVHALAGHTAEARRLLRVVGAADGNAFGVARAYAALGEADSAFAWLGRSSWQWPHRAVLTDPALDPLRADPRFAALAARVDREMGVR